MSKRPSTYTLHRQSGTWWFIKKGQEPVAHITRGGNHSFNLHQDGSFHSIGTGYRSIKDALFSYNQLFPKTKKDKRYQKVSLLIRQEGINEFSKIFEHIPVSVVADDLFITERRLAKLILHPELIRMAEIVNMAELFNIEVVEINRLIRYPPHQ